MLRRHPPMRVRAWLYQIHSWLGLISGIFLVVISVTGVALLFRGEIDRRYSSSLSKVAVRGERLPYDQLLRAYVAERLPGRLEAVSLPSTPEEPLRLGIDNNGRYEEAWLDAYTGRLIAHGPETFSASGWLDTLHYRLLAGDAGELWAGFIAFVLVLASATGLYVQGRFFVALLRWPRQRTRLRDSHNLIGTWALLASILFGLTGGWMCRYALFRSVSHEPAGRASELAPVADRYLRDAATVPGFEPHLILYPSRNGEPVEVLGASALTTRNWFYGRNAYRLTFNGRTGQMVSRFDPTKSSFAPTSDDLIFAVHSGQYRMRMPLWLKLLYAVFGLAPAFLAFTGYWLYFRRLARNRRTRQRLLLETTS